MNNSENCGNCRFWLPSVRLKHKLIARSDAIASLRSKWKKDIGTSDKGLCRRHAPFASALTTVWVKTRAEHWCGEYEPMPEDEEPGPGE